MTVVLIQFKEVSKKYYFNPNGLTLNPQDKVIVETQKGLEIGIVVSMKEVNQADLVHALKDVLRLATDQDLAQAQSNSEKLPEIIEKAKGIIESHELGMKVINAEITLDQRKLIIYFEAEGRIDFRDLVKDLSEHFTQRIELRQIGPRDTAKMVGGLGPCGLMLCCSTFIGEFDTISIKMAKNQNLSLNPQKISGVCGKLLCCIKYEDDVYTELKEGLPDLNQRVLTPIGKAQVVAVNILGRKVRVRSEEGIYEWFSIDALNQAAELDNPTPKQQ